ETRDLNAAGRPARRIGRDRLDPFHHRAGNERDVETDRRLHVLLEPEMLRDLHRIVLLVELVQGRSGRDCSDIGTSKNYPSKLSITARKASPKRSRLVSPMPG